MKLYECTFPRECEHKEKQIEGKGGLVTFLCTWVGYCPKQARDKPKRKSRSHDIHDMRQTSIEAFDEVTNLGNKQQEVLAVIKKHCDCKDYLTDREIAVELGYKDPNKVRPRRYELMKLGLIQEAGTRKCRVTGKRAIIWKCMQA